MSLLKPHRGDFTIHKYTYNYVLILSNKKWVHLWVANIQTTTTFWLLSKLHSWNVTSLHSGKNRQIWNRYLCKLTLYSQQHLFPFGLTVVHKMCFHMAALQRLYSHMHLAGNCVQEKLSQRQINVLISPSFGHLYKTLHKLLHVFKYWTVVH